MATSNFTTLNGTTVAVDTTTVTELTVGVNTASTYIHTTPNNGVEVLGTMAATAAQLAAAGMNPVDHYTPQFDDYTTFQ